MVDSKCKKCRRAGQKLFLKGDRCFSQKCALVRRSYKPGVHGNRRGRRGGRLSEYGQQLSEKQKIRHAYGVSEGQFKGYFKSIAEQPGNKEELFIQQLETRLDNVVFRFGWARSRAAARQIVNHNHILVNKKRVNVPSYQVSPGDIISIREKSRKSPLFAHFSAKSGGSGASPVPAWLALEKDKFSGAVKGMPKIEEFGQIAEISKIIEFYSR